MDLFFHLFFEFLNFVRESLTSDADLNNAQKEGVCARALRLPACADGQTRARQARQGRQGRGWR